MYWVDPFTSLGPGDEPGGDGGKCRPAAFANSNKDGGCPRPSAVTNGENENGGSTLVMGNGKCRGATEDISQTR